jgi:type VI secretion system protein ImpJ
MFLRPHHFQAAQRFAEDQTHRGGKWDVHHNWGLRHIDIDREALANYRFVVRSLQARLRDGTPIAVPEDGILPALDFRQAPFERDQTLTVFLAVPVLHLGKANVAADGSAEGTRFRLDNQELEDENTGVNPQPLQVRLLNLRLLLSTQDHAGYSVLPLARVVKADKPQATPELDATYIPPLLACDAWTPLWGDIIQAIYHRIGQKIDQRAGEAVSRAISFDSQTQGDGLLLAQLRELNEASALLGTLAFAEGVHPLWAYLELTPPWTRSSVAAPSD